MEDLLDPVRTTIISPKASKPESELESIGGKHESKSIPSNGLSPEIALDALKTQPDFDLLRRILSFLSTNLNNPKEFSIRAPGPLSAQLINVILTTTVPDFWSSHLRSDRPDDEASARNQLISCLRSVTGVGAILAKLRALISTHKQSKNESAASQHAQDLLEILSETVQGDKFITSTWTSINTLVHTESQRLVLWKEFISIIGSGKVISIAAQTQDITASLSELKQGVWLGDGSQYAKWLARNVVNFATAQNDVGSIRSQNLAEIGSKALNLGYTDAMVDEMVRLMVKRDNDSSLPLRNLLILSRAHERRKYTQSIVRVIDKRYVPSVGDFGMTSRHSKYISGAAALVKSMIVSDRGSPEIKEAFVEVWATMPNSGINPSIGMIRVALAAIASDNEHTQTILEKAMTSFGDQLFIRHMPLMQQEANAQLLLLSAGYVHRSQPMYLFTLARSSTHLNAISNRLSASSPRACFLGMVVGMAISKLIDKPGNQMNFGTEELETDEAKAYLGLVHVNDTVGTIQDLLEPTSMINGELAKAAVLPKPSKSTKNPVAVSSSKSVRVSTSTRAQTAIQGPRITEIEEYGEDVLLDDLTPYEKPDSDPEDADEDPTVADRNKPTAPVYIRDLIAGLRDTENYDRQRLAIASAATLIRRKANFGKELSDRAQELASTLVGMSDPFEIGNFQELRLQAMIALVVGEPMQLAPWFGQTFFEGDYSIMQRVSVLTALGMGARELGGFKDEDAHLTGADDLPDNAFPTKLLPQKYHKLYVSGTSRVNATTKRLEQSIIEPMALNAADQATGPNALKVRTFSSRVDHEKKRKKPVANPLARIVGEKFFFPLTGRWWTHMQAYGARSTDNIHVSPLLLVPYLRTLALILHAAGPLSADLPSMTSEFWALLLSLLQTPALNTATDFDVTVLEAVLFSLLTMIELNTESDSGQRIVRDQAKELLETQAWVDEIFDRLGGGGKADEEGHRVRALAAGLLVKVREIVEKYQRSLVGTMLDF